LAASSCGWLETQMSRPGVEVWAVAAWLPPQISMHWRPRIGHVLGISAMLLPRPRAAGLADVRIGLAPRSGRPPGDVGAQVRETDGPRRTGVDYAGVAESLPLVHPQESMQLSWGLFVVVHVSGLRGAVCPGGPVYARRTAASKRA